jgi:ribosomal protein S3AE
MPRILSIRSSDQVADKGVLATVEEQKQFGIRIIQLPATLHNDMWDGATQSQKQEINKAISDFIKSAKQNPSLLAGMAVYSILEWTGIQK